MCLLIKILISKALGSYILYSNITCFKQQKLTSTNMWLDAKWTVKSKSSYVGGGITVGQGHVYLLVISKIFNRTKTYLFNLQFSYFYSLLWLINFGSYSTDIYIVGKQNISLQQTAPRHVSSWTALQQINFNESVLASNCKNQFLDAYTTHKCKKNSVIM